MLQIFILRSSAVSRSVHPELKNHNWKKHQGILTFYIAFISSSPLGSVSHWQNPVSKFAFCCAPCQNHGKKHFLKAWQREFFCVCHIVTQGHQQYRTHLPGQGVQEMQVQSPGQEEPLEEGMATHPSILAWRIPWTEEPDKLQSVGSQSWMQLKRLSTQHTHDPCQARGMWLLALNSPGSSHSSQ